MAHGDRDSYYLSSKKKDEIESEIRSYVTFVIWVPVLTAVDS